MDNDAAFARPDQAGEAEGFEVRADALIKLVVNHRERHSHPLRCAQQANRGGLLRPHQPGRIDEAAPVDEVLQVVKGCAVGVQNAERVQCAEDEVKAFFGEPRRIFTVDAARNQERFVKEVVLEGDFEFAFGEQLPGDFAPFKACRDRPLGRVDPLARESADGVDSALGAAGDTAIHSRGIGGGSHLAFLQKARFLAYILYAFSI